MCDPCVGLILVWDCDCEAELDTDWEGVGFGAVVVGVALGTLVVEDIVNVKKKVCLGYTRCVKFKLSFEEKLASDLVFIRLLTAPLRHYWLFIE